MRGVQRIRRGGGLRASLGESESDLQAAVVQFLGLALPPECWFCHIANEGKRGPKAQAELKRSGVRAGCPDLLIVWLGRCIWIELKTLSGSLSAAQKAVHKHLWSAGCKVHVCRSVGEVVRALVGEGIQMRSVVVGGVK